MPPTLSRSPAFSHPAVGWLLGLMLVASTQAGPAAAERHPDATRRPGVARGEVTDLVFGRSKIYPDTKRHYSVYKPAAMVNRSLREPAALMVFLDGHAYLSEGQFNATAILDNLIASGDMPPTVAVFVDPGFYRKQLIETAGRLPEPRGWNPTPGNRSVEYDTVSDEYGRFLTDELLPLAYAATRIDPKMVSSDPKMRALCGSSSGGICAFKVAWFAPDQFGKAISHIGSFVDIRGGHNFIPMIRKEDKRDIRVVIQDGSGDLDNRFGNWWLANQQMAAALAFRDYDHKTYWGEGGHNNNDASAVLPDEMRWLWRDWKSD